MVWLLTLAVGRGRSGITDTCYRKQYPESWAASAGDADQGGDGTKAGR